MSQSEGHGPGGPGRAPKGFSSRLVIAAAIAGAVTSSGAIFLALDVTSVARVINPYISLQILLSGLVLMATLLVAVRTNSSKRSSDRPGDLVPCPRCEGEGLCEPPERGVGMAKFGTRVGG